MSSAFSRLPALLFAANTAVSPSPALIPTYPPCAFPAPYDSTIRPSACSVAEKFAAPPPR